MTYRSDGFNPKRFANPAYNVGLGRWTLLALWVTACNSGLAAEIHDLADQVATVGHELVVEIDGSDPDGGRFTYGVHTDISLQGNAMITQTPSGMGVFRWTPLAEDLGMHAFDFTVDDGSNTTTVTISIEVRSAAGAVPIFRQPLGDRHGRRSGDAAVRDGRHRDRGSRHRHASRSRRRRR